MIDTYGLSYEVFYEVYRCMHSLYISVIVVVIKYTLAKFTKRLCLTNVLVNVWLHEKGKCLSRNMLTIIPCTHTDTMGSRPQPACSREFEGFARLECETVRGYHNLGQFTTTSSDVESGRRRGRGNCLWRLSGGVLDVHRLSHQNRMGHLTPKITPRSARHTEHKPVRSE